MIHTIANIIYTVLSIELKVDLYILRSVRSDAFTLLLFLLKSSMNSDVSISVLAYIELYLPSAPMISFIN